MTKPSKNHPNKSIVNFLVYKYTDYFLTKFIPYYKGVMVDLGCGEAPYKEFFFTVCRPIYRCRLDKFLP